MTQTPPPISNAPDSTAGREAAPGLVDQAQDKVGQVVDQAQSTAGQVTEQAKQQATSQLESQKERAVDSLVTVAQALRQTSQHLREQEQGTAGQYIEKAAERVEGLTNYLRSNDIPQLLGETQDFARRQPVMFVGGALALGFLGARFLMSSGQRSSAPRTLSQTEGAYGGYGSWPHESLYGRPPGPSANPGASTVSGADPWRRPNAENA